MKTLKIANSEKRNHFTITIQTDEWYTEQDEDRGVWVYVKVGVVDINNTPLFARGYLDHGSWIYVRQSMTDNVLCLAMRITSTGKFTDVVCYVPTPEQYFLC